MRKSLVIATLLVLCTGLTAFAGVPDPSRSGCELKGYQAVPNCQFRFRHDAGLDTLSVAITLRDAFDDVVPNCSTSVTLVPNAGTVAYCNCCPDQIGGVTNAAGIITLGGWACIGGRGTLDVCVTAHCQGNIAIGCKEINFTGPDMDGDCLDTDVIDLGLWAGGISPYGLASDYNCDGTVSVIDLGIDLPVVSRGSDRMFEGAPPRRRPFSLPPRQGQAAG
jgi:hypothetical protein